MKSDHRLSSMRHDRLVTAGLLALAAALPAAADSVANETYNWSAELVEVDEPARTVTVQSRLVGDAKIDFDALEAAGVRRIVAGKAPADDRLTLPIELVSAEHNAQYVRFKVAVPSDDLPRIASLQPGSWITATSPRRAERFEEAVADMRPYNDVG
jgi:hypothetical protein